jgi:hypothetical protein
VLLPTQKKASAQGDESSQTVRKAREELQVEEAHRGPRTWARAVVVEGLDEDRALVHRVRSAPDLVRVLLQRSYQLAVVRGRPAAPRGPCNTAQTASPSASRSCRLRLGRPEACLPSSTSPAATPPTTERMRWTRPVARTETLHST